MTISDEALICNLLYRYAELMDSGDFAATAELFRHARVVLDPANNVSVDADGLLKLWTDSVIRYPDGTPRTKHVTTNPIVEINDETGTATCRSYYTVFQQTDTLPLQPIVAGRYHDRFEHAAGTWRFTERDYSLVDLVGDISQHLRLPVGQGGGGGIGANVSDPDLTVLRAERDIERQLVRFARAMDEREWGVLEGIMFEDATADVGTGVLSGSGAIIGVIRSHLDACGPTQHLLGSIMVDVRGTTATSRAYVRDVHFGVGEREHLTFSTLGDYEDTWELDGAQWRLRHRTKHNRAQLGTLAVFGFLEDVTSERPS